MSKDVFLWLMSNMFLLLGLMGVIAHVGATIAVKIAEILGFGEHRPLVFVLDQIHNDLEQGKEVNVREYFNEN